MMNVENFVNILEWGTLLAIFDSDIQTTIINGRYGVNITSLDVENIKNRKVLSINTSGDYDIELVI